jgi:hypothetical protein
MNAQQRNFVFDITNLIAPNVIHQRDEDVSKIDRPIESEGIKMISYVFS